MFTIRHTVLFLTPSVVAVVLNYGTAQLQVDVRQMAGGLVVGTDPQRWLGESVEAFRRMSNHLEIMTIASIALIGIISGFLIPVGSSPRTNVNFF